jgi:hypothetical protein
MGRGATNLGADGGRMEVGGLRYHRRWYFRRNEDEEEGDSAGGERAEGRRQKTRRLSVLSDDKRHVV